MSTIFSRIILKKWSKSSLQLILKNKIKSNKRELIFKNNKLQKMKRSLLSSIYLLSIYY